MAQVAPGLDGVVPRDRIRRSHVLLLVGSLAAIPAGLVGFGILVPQLASTEARVSLLAVLLAYYALRAFLPRELSASQTEVHWKKPLHPRLVIPRGEVAGIQLVTATGEVYLVNRQGRSLLSVDRGFSPSEIGSFAAYLGVPVREVPTAPAVDPEAEARLRPIRARGRRHRDMIASGVLSLVCLSLVAGLAFFVADAARSFAAYQRAGECTTLPNDPLACRYETTAVITGITQRSKSVGVDLLFSTDLFSFGNHRSYLSRLPLDANPTPVIGESAQVEVWNRQTVTRLNGAETLEFDTLRSNSSWFLLVAASIFPLFAIVGFLYSWLAPIRPNEGAP